MSLPKSLKTRTITGIIFGAVTIGFIFAHSLTYLLFLFIVCIVCAYELCQMVDPDAAQSKRLVMASLLTLPILIANHFGLNWWPEIAVGLLGMILLFTLYNPSTVIKNMTLFGAGFVYLSLPLTLAYQVGIENGVYDYKLILYPLFLIWANDVFAYFIGSLIGQRKMSPLISPNKTWEGTIGGILVCGLFSIFLGQFISLPWLIAAVFGLGVGIISTLGDLFESAIKRSVGVKDSGQILPGHGGFLDRFDSFIFVMPFAWIFWNYYSSS